MPSNFDMIENVYGRDAAESVRKMMDLAQEAVNKVHELYAQINAKDAEVARLRDALRPFADAWELNDLDEGENLAWRNLNIWCTETTDFDHIREPLRGRHLRAAHLALYPNTGDDADTGGDGE